MQFYLSKVLSKSKQVYNFHLHIKKTNELKIKDIDIQKLGKRDVGTNPPHGRVDMPRVQVYQKRSTGLYEQEKNPTGDVDNQPEETRGISWNTHTNTAMYTKRDNVTMSKWTHQNIFSKGAVSHWCCVGNNNQKIVKKVPIYIFHETFVKYILKEKSSTHWMQCVVRDMRYTVKYFQNKHNPKSMSVDDAEIQQQKVKIMLTESQD